jgi:hypothetical protein
VSGRPCGNGFRLRRTSLRAIRGNAASHTKCPWGQTSAKFQFTLSSGFADETGQWSLAGAATSSTVTQDAGTGASTTNGTLSVNTTTNVNGTNAGLSNQYSPGITATSGVSCGMANNLFYGCYKAQQSGGASTALSVWSPATKRYYNATCAPPNGVITCSVSGTTDPNAQVQLTQAALNAYSPQQASACGEPRCGPERLRTASSPSGLRESRFSRLLGFVARGGARRLRFRRQVRPRAESR